MSFTDFILHLKNLNYQDTQIKYMQIDNIVKINNILQFHNIAQDLYNFLINVGVSEEILNYIDFGKKVLESTRKSYKEYYTEDDIKIVQTIYAADFEFFENFNKKITEF